MPISVDFAKVVEAVQQTREIVLDKKLKSDIVVKGEADFVTSVDFKISKLIGEKLAVITPDIGFMSEEESAVPKGTRWILDPIDGTTNLIYDYNMCSVSLALCVDEIIVFGVVYNPFNGDLFVAKKGEGAYYNGQRMGKAPDREINKCLIEFGAGATKKHQTELAFSVAKRVFSKCLDLRRICSSALSICYNAAGKINGYFEKELKPWDYAAAGLILEECGGKITDWQGQKINYIEPCSIVCGTPKAYDFLIKTVSESEKEFKL